MGFFSQKIRCTPDPEIPNPFFRSTSMAQPRRLRVGIASFSYGGNGGIRSQVPDVGDWKLDTILAARKDPRIEEIFHFDLADTPITMTRNRAVLSAREHGADVLIMVDSDMSPDSEPDGKPFFDTSFDFLYKHYDRGPVCIGAPYCGPPPDELVYVFEWRNRRNEDPNPDFKIDMYPRNVAAMMTGIVPAAALPTGLIMYDMRCFDLTEPRDEHDDPWFYYAWKTKHAADKTGTEDVMQTRDLSLMGIQKLGYNPVFCNWDAWAGHWKPYLVRKPRPIGADYVSNKFLEAANRNVRANNRRGYIDVSRGIIPAAAYYNGSSDRPVDVPGLPQAPAPGSVLEAQAGAASVLGLPAQSGGQTADVADPQAQGGRESSQEGAGTTRAAHHGVHRRARAEDGGARTARRSARRANPPRGNKRAGK
jgi:hypothetical protein